MVTLEQFKQKVKESFWTDMKQLSEEEVDNFLNSEEMSELIESRYHEEVQELKEGKLTEKILENGVVHGVAYCLYMLY